MKWKLLISFFMILLLGGCTATRYATAERHLEKGEYNQAIRAYLRLLDPHSRGGKKYIYYDKEATTGISIAYWHMRKYSTSVRILKTVLDKDPTYGKALFYLGMSYEAMGREDEAIRVYRKYPSVPTNNSFRSVMVGRLNWVVRRKISREIQAALENEDQLDPATFPEKSIAVLYFLSLSEDPQWEPLKTGFAEMLITDLSQVEELQVVERLRINQLMQELRLGMSGLVDQETAPRLAKLMGARTLVKGSYMVMSNLKMTLDAGIYNIEKIHIPNSTSMEGSLIHLFRLEKELVLRILEHFGIQLSPKKREQILKIPTQNMGAFLSYCQGLVALDGGDFKTAQQYFHRAVRLDDSFQQAKDRLMAPKIWEATHNRNLNRVNHELADLIKTGKKGSAEFVYIPPVDLVSPWNRLQWMATYQRAGFIPSNDTRESFIDASINSAPVLPVQLDEPPNPTKIQ